MKRALLSASLFLAAAVLVGPPAAAAQQGARVDLDLYYDEPVIPAGGTGTVTFTVANSGADATAPADLTIATSVFVTAMALPRSCEFLYRDADADPTVPQIIRCTVPPLPQGAGVDFRLVLGAAEDAPAGETYGTATVLPRASDVDQHLADNLGFPSVVVTDPAAAPTGPASAHVTDLYLTSDIPAAAVGAPGMQTLIVGNRGPQPGAGPVRVTIGTPPMVRVGTLPAGCEFRYDSPDPGAPQLVSCSLPALPMSGTAVVRLPLVPEFGAPVQTSWGIAGAFPDSAAGATDLDPVAANNLVEPGVQVIG